MSADPPELNANLSVAQTTSATRLRRQIAVGWTGLAALGVVLILAGLARAGFFAFTWQKFTMFDYGVYTNMIWNCGRGEWFRCLIDRSYLATHLSFTLALMGPLFYLWDHPFLLWGVQWLMLAAGVGLLAWTAHRHRVPPFLTATIAMFYVGYHYTQQVMLCEFHGVSLYYLLVPALYYCLCFRRGWGWLPWLLLLGVREDAALVAIPLLLYFAIRDRWKTGYLYAALSLLYLLIALQWLFPLLAGMTIQARRQGYLNQPWTLFLKPARLQLRAQALGWVLLPAAPFISRRGWIPLLVFPFIPLMIAMSAGTSNQYSLALHYPATIMALLGVAMVEAAARWPTCPGRRNATTGRMPWGAAAALLLITAASYRYRGFLPKSVLRNPKEICYRAPENSGLQALQAMRYVPRKGVLLCPSHLAGFLANRRDIIDWPNYNPGAHSIDLLVHEMKYLDSRRHGFRSWLADDAFGVVYFDGNVVILQRGADPQWNHWVLQAYQLALAGTPMDPKALPTEINPRK